MTDEIDFEVKVNYPPEIRKFNPPGDTVVTVCNGVKQTFKAKVWDPDEEDVLSARIYLMRDPYTGGGWDFQGECSPSLDQAEDEEATGALLHPECGLTLYGAGEGDLLMVKIQVSDLGYQAGDVAKEGARVAEVLWVLEATLDPLICPQ